MIQRTMQPTGVLDLNVQRRRPSLRLPAKPARVSILQMIRDGFPRPGLTREVNAWRLRNCWRLVAPIARVALIQRFGGVALVPQLRLAAYRQREVSPGVWEAVRLDLGLAALKVVTTAGVNYLVDAFQTTTEPENFKYHGFGTGTNAEASGDTALQTELTTQYVTNSTRPTGTQTEGASANIYRSVATLSPDSGGTIAITEHGLFSADAAGTLWDRSVFSAVNLVAGSDSLQATYDVTFAAGG